MGDVDLRTSVDGEPPMEGSTTYKRTCRNEHVIARSIESGAAMFDPDPMKGPDQVEIPHHRGMNLALPSSPQSAGCSLEVVARDERESRMLV